MTEPTEKKGMSKGCMIALIIGIVLLVMIIAAAVTCYLKGSDIVKFGVVSILNNSKTIVAENPVPGVDTVQYDAMVDAFVTKFNEEEFDAEKVGDFTKTIQPLAAAKTLDSADVWLFMNAMVDYYPELESYLPQEIEDEALIDSTATAEPATTE